MDVLKYLDVLVGLSVVMVLLSPVVSAWTQFWMWASRARPYILRIGIAKLIRHLDGNPFDDFETASVRVMNGAHEVPDLPVSIGGVARGQTGPNGELLVRDIDSVLTPTNGQLAIALGHPGEPARQGYLVTVTLTPADSGGDTEITSPSTDATGKTRVTYAFRGQGPLSSILAEVRTYDSYRNSVAARVACVVNSGPDAGKTVPVQTTADGIGTFRYPKDSAPASYELELLIANGTGALAGHTAVFRFLRNAAQDRTVAGITGPNGDVMLPAPTGMGPPLSPDDADRIAKAVLSHPMVGTRTSPAGVIQREELTGILLDLADDSSQPEGVIDSDSQQALRRALAANGIHSPGKTLSDIRTAAQTLEKNEPGTAAHLRSAEAIITAAQSDFVGKINYWFDQTMDRITQQYAFHARWVTVIGAALVAFAIQFDSVDLLKRLSTDNKLRDSLLSEATAQQAQIDRIADSKTADGQSEQSDVEVAKSKRNEIEQTLAKLRAPGLAIFPDHFVWEELPQARLIRNQWKRPYSDRLELALGEAVFEIEPRWRKDPLTDIKTAIDGSLAPVNTKIERNEDEDELVLKGDGVTPPHLVDDRGQEMLSFSNEVAQARLKDDVSWMSGIGNPQPLQLFVGNVEAQGPPTLTLAPGAATTRAALIQALITAIQKVHAGVIVTSDPAKGTLLLTATDSNTSWIELRWQKDDPLSNILTDTEFVPTIGRVPLKRLMDGSASRTLNGAKTPDDFVRRLDSARASAGMTATIERPDALIVASHRMGVIQLRWRPGHPETNMFNSFQETSGWDWGMLKTSFPGMLVSWALLSLGAPFWYDALKGLLKLRPLLAGKDDEQRSDRQTENKK